MLQVPLNKDIREIEPKLIGPFTTRQCICVVVAAALAIPTALLVPLPVPGKVAVGGILAAIPIVFGWVKWMGLYPEKFIPIFYQLYFISQNRPYITKEPFPGLSDGTTIKKTKKSKEYKAYK